MRSRNNKAGATLQPRQLWRLLIFPLCLAAIIGYALPAINVHLSFLGMTYSFDFRLSTIFEEEGAVGRLNLADSDLADILAESEVMRDIARRIVIGVVSYVLALIFFIAVVVKFIIVGYKSTGSSRRPVEIIFSATAIFLHGISARAILSVPDMVASALADLLGFFARFVNTRGILTIDLGAGYWVTLGAMLALLVTCVFSTIKSHRG